MDVGEVAPDGRSVAVDVSEVPITISLALTVGHGQVLLECTAPSALIYPACNQLMNEMHDRIKKAHHAALTGGNSDA